jgi:large subunit ribosomal protein L17
MEHRRALLKNLASSLIEHKRITTTLAKAKALRRYIEPLITKSKDNTTHSRRVVFSYLNNKEAVKELFSNIATAIGDRPGGYVRVIRTGFRKGDGAEMAMIELVDFNADYAAKEGAAGPGKGKRRRTRRGGKAGVVAGAVATASAAMSDMKDAIEEKLEAVEDKLDEIEDAIEEKVDDVIDSITGDDKEEKEA